MAISPQDITGLVLAGGRGSRMGGVDKGLQTLNGDALVTHVLRRLRPQVGFLAVNANRHLSEYRALGLPVWPDSVLDQPGPLAGILAGLQHCETPYLLTVPCDGPIFPMDLVARLSRALLTPVQGEAADLAMAVTVDGTGQRQRQPVYCLMRAELRGDLANFLDSGQRSVERWAARRRLAEAAFDSGDDAFFNVNTLPDLQHLADWPAT